jgi:6-phosphogluconolactonase
MIRDTRTRASIATIIGATLFATSSATATTLYTETNSPSGNQVQVYETLPHGNPTLTAEAATGGLGSGAGLGSQGSLALSGDFVFAVNWRQRSSARTTS